MMPRQADPAAQFRLLYEAGPVDFGATIRRHEIADDSELAEWIEADARERLSRGLPVELSRYLDAVSALHSHPVALDAAIEFSLRWLRATEGGGDQRRAAARLSALHPNLADLIATSAQLDQVLLTSRTVNNTFRSRDRFPLPSDFGPPEASGRPRYELRDSLGEGVSGHVYLAVDRRLSDAGHPAWVAIKILRPLHLDTVDRLRFQDEAAKARRINHPNVVRVLDRGVQPPDLDYIVSEYVDGSHLGTWVQRLPSRPKPREAAAMVRKLALGLQAAHAAGLVHCDLKPDNILLTKEGEPRIADFGLSHQWADDAGDVAPDRPVGNRAFAAPEQLLAKRGAFTPAADVYALGGILLWLLTGRYANGATVDEVESRLDAIGRSTTATQTVSLEGITDPDLAAICRRALQPQPQDRYQSADALAADLDAWIAYRPLTGSKTSLKRRTTLLLRRQPLLIVAGAAVVALAVLAGLLLGASERRRLDASLKATEEIAKKDHEMLEQSRAAVESMFRNYQNARVAADWLPNVTVLETVAGPFLKHLGKGTESIWSSRIDLVRRHLESENQAGNTGHAEYLMWQSVLGYWLMQAGKYDQADQQLNEARAGWSRNVAQDDTWIKYVDEIIRCSQVKRALASVSPAADPNAPTRTLSPAERDRLRPVAAELERGVVVFTGLRNGGNLHKQVLDCLDAVYSPQLLDDPAGRDRVRRLMRELELPTASTP
ncbi:MAG: serine/threonine-protein kinase [Phycisphaerales bacterium]